MREINAGDRLDQYDLTELLARSGMASIFKAIDRKSGATVAVKVPHMQYESDVAFFQRFQREEQIGLKLDHPNIVRVLTPEKKSRIYIAMEFAEGRSLRAVQGERGAQSISLRHVGAPFGQADPLQGAPRAAGDPAGSRDADEA